ncbi:hypothetical protein CK203_034657 [Vitis vinifera]|uniref:Reverse transcriptase domain-containing protein n=1 Tax=Vitis vinifera TaxID=29760 RepID=A0A438HWH3_VITVI|nr:hypothetical protein CK203_034657 [Vitis vinifera]
MLIANEAIDLILKNDECGILCKLDIEKAYDHVDCLRGLGQGDPLSPYLFVIAMGVFSFLLKRRVNRGFLLSCRVKGKSGEGVQISHLLFADDTLVFCQANQDQMTYLSWLLMWFEVVSELRINLEKSELIPVDSVVNIDDLAMNFGCRVGSLPSTYLGLPLGASIKSVIVWDGVKKRFRKKKGGLGIKCLSTHNKALLCKWNSPFANKREALWNQVIRGRYREERGGWCSREVRGVYGVGLWKGIRMVWDIVDPLAEGSRGWGDGTLVSQDPLMIGRWRKWKASWGGCMEESVR